MSDTLDQLCINAAQFLSVDAMPKGAAALVFVLMFAVPTG